MREDLLIVKTYAESLPEEGELDIIDKLASLSKPFLKKIDLKNPP